MAYDRIFREGNGVYYRVVTDQFPRKLFKVSLFYIGMHSNIGRHALREVEAGIQRPFKPGAHNA